MEDLNNVCRICLKLISCQTFLDNVECTMGKLEAVIPDMQVQLSISSLMCNKCIQLLNDIYNFKYNCFKTEETILLRISKIKSDLKLNLSDIMPWTDNNPRLIKNNMEKICRTCLKLYEEDGQIMNEDVLHQLKVCIPELDTNMTLNPDMCGMCIKILREWNEFKMTYLNTEKLITHYCTTFSINRGNIDLNKFISFTKGWNRRSMEMSEYFPTDQEFKIEFDYSETSLQMPMEEDNRKCNQTEEENDNKNIKIIIMETVETVLKPMKRNGIYMYVCPKCKKIIKNMASHMSEHREYVKLFYQCYKCDYQNSSYVDLRKHLLTHKQGILDQLYNCDQCSFQARQKGNLMTHLLVHKKTYEIKMFRCHLCKFQARQKGNLKTHMLTHKNPKEIVMFKCNLCKYQARQKGNLQTHMLKKHKNFNEKALEEALFYKCDKCAYKAKHKPCLKKHMVVHES